MNTLKSIAVVTLICFSLQQLVGCTSMQPLRQDLPPELIVKEVKPREKVIIVDRDFLQHTIKVDSVTTNQITGSGKVFRFDEIELIYTSQLSGDKNKEGLTITAAVIVMTLVFFVIAYNAAVSAY